MLPLLDRIRCRNCRETQIQLFGQKIPNLASRLLQMPPHSPLLYCSTGNTTGGGSWRQVGRVGWVGWVGEGCPCSFTSVSHFELCKVHFLLERRCLLAFLFERNYFDFESYLRLVSTTYGCYRKKLCLKNVLRQSIRSAVITYLKEGMADIT